MKIEDLVAKLKEEGKNDEEIKLELENLKKDIDAYLGKAVDVDQEKLHQIFGV